MTVPVPYRAAVIGYGLGGAAFHAPLLAALPEFDLVAVVTGNGERAAAVASRYPGTRVVAEVAELYALGIDVAVVTTPNITHAQVAGDLIDHGIATVVDKPVATSSADARELIARAEAGGVLLTVYQNRRWDSDYLTARDLIRSGQLGTVIRFESRFERWRPQIRPGWKETPGPGSGVLFDLGPHLIDQAIHLFGPPVEVYSEVRRVRQGALVEDDAFLALTHPGGIASHLSVSAIAGAPGPRFRVLGDRGAFVQTGLDQQEARLRAGDVPAGVGWGKVAESGWGWLCHGDDCRPVPSRAGDYPQFYRLLAAALAGEGPLPVDPRDTVMALEVIEAALAAG